MDLNRVTLLGRLVRDPEVRTTPTGKTVASVTVATGRVWKDQSGTKQEKSEFHNCVLWGKIGEIAGQYLNKGRRVYVEGRLETRDWTDQAGVKKYRTEIIVDNLIMLDGGTRAGANGGAGGAEAVGNFSSKPNPAPVDDSISEEIKVEDIPF
ncbi:MAG TPA: single-stranded DNA-binding protein [Candidatus Magasanikbacteria bacterium]|nr:single-stranded DNA-binding protein [Candidatus Magasanikbacteria bacterium]